jgi:hypothetical protein
MANIFIDNKCNSKLLEAWFWPNRYNKRKEMAQSDVVQVWRGWAGGLAVDANLWLLDLQICVALHQDGQ